MKKILAVFTPYAKVTQSTKLIIVGLWLASVLAFWMSGASVLIPRPNEVVVALGKLWVNDALGRELMSSFSTFIQALGLSTFISLTLAYLTVLPSIVPVTAMVSKFRFLGMAGLTLIFTLIFTGGHAYKVALMTFGISVFFTTSMTAVVAGITKETLDHARTLRMSDWRIVWEVVVLGTLSQAFDILLQNAAIGFMLLPFVEGLVRSEGGIGRLLLNQNKHMMMAEVFAIQICILGIGLGQDSLIGAIKNIFCPYAKLTLEKK